MSHAGNRNGHHDIDLPEATLMADSTSHAFSADSITHALTSEPPTLHHLSSFHESQMI